LRQAPQAGKHALAALRSSNLACRGLIAHELAQIKAAARERNETDRDADQCQRPEKGPSRAGGDCSETDFPTQGKYPIEDAAQEAGAAGGR